MMNTSPATTVWLWLSPLCALCAVALGAFGAHGLKPILSVEAMAVYQTGVTYHMWHALGLFCIGLLQRQLPGVNLLNWAGSLMFIGIILFSGSLYALAVFNIKALGMITPFGGLAFMGAWLLLAVVARKHSFL